MPGNIPSCNWVYTNSTSIHPGGAAPHCASLQTYFVRILSVWGLLVVLEREHHYLLSAFCLRSRFSSSSFLHILGLWLLSVFTPRFGWSVLWSDAHEQLLWMVLLNVSHLAVDNLLLWPLAYSAHIAWSELCQEMSLLSGLLDTFPVVVQN